MSMPIDLRSDTVTKPGEAMREAMARAPVGDDVFGEDPTINALQEKAANLLGLEAALFVPSGTMANQLAIKILTSPGDEVLLEGSSHPVTSEAGAAAVISGVLFRHLPGRRGVLDPEQVAGSIRQGNIHYAPTSLVCLENTHNQGGGTVYPLETVARIRKIALERGLKMHLDGARLFNACVASGHKPADYARHFETVSFCLSKGLGAPVGSMLGGTRELIDRAVHWRKRLGGGMRQAGILAAAGLYALDNNVSRLADDHANARFLADGLAELNGISLNPAEVETNIVIFEVSKPGLTAPALAERLRQNGVLVLAFSPVRIRAVTHLDVNLSDIKQALIIIKKTVV